MSSSPPCRHFLRGACRYGDACKFAHAARDADAARAPRSRSRKTRRKDSRQKVKRFREWLAREFADALDGGVVLDVAGGKGVLAFDLMNSTNAAEVWVIDPRAMRLGRLRRRFALGFHLRERERDAATIRVREPKHLRVYWSREVYAREDAAWEARVRASNVAARASRWCVSGLVADDRRDARYEDAGATVRVVDGAVDIAPSTDRRSDDDDDDDDDGDAGDDADGEIELDQDAVVSALDDVLRRVSIVVAMHPDQATDAAVDFALERNLPFAVVPCCVYAKEFGKRRLADGSRVTTHAHLVDHLVQKAGLTDVRVAELPFPGKNVVVYGTGRRASTCVAVQTPQRGGVGE